MSADAATAARVYAHIKHFVLSGEHGPGTPLNLQMLALESGASITPVRDALQRLVGERLAELGPGHGFMVPDLGQDAVRDLYQWHAWLSSAAVGQDHPLPQKMEVAHAIEQLDPGDSVGIAMATKDLFSHLGRSAPNGEHRTALRMAGERLTPLRVHESSLPDRLGELRLLWRLTGQGQPGHLRRAIGNYHRRRLRRITSIIEHWRLASRS